MANIHLQFRRGTAAEWTSANPILASGEFGVETDTNMYKIGNGVKPWTTLPYPTNGPQSPYIGWISQPGVSSANSLAASADLTKLIVVTQSSHIWISTDSGVTWTQQSSSGLPEEIYLYLLTSSADGTRLVAGAYVSGGGGRIYTSLDSGVTWIERFNNGQAQRTVSSADGTKLTAVIYDPYTGMNIYTSWDMGATWINRTTGTPLEGIWVNWITCSADGTKLAITTYAQDYNLWTSSDSGVTWINRTAGTPLSGNDFNGVTMSANGGRLFFTVAGHLYESTDIGASWTLVPLPPNSYPSGITVSGDGKVLALQGTGSAGGWGISKGVWNGISWAFGPNSGATYNNPLVSTDGSKFAVIGGLGDVQTSFDSDSYYPSPNSAYYALQDGEVLALQYSCACKEIYVDPSGLVGSNAYASIVLPFPDPCLDPMVNGHPSIFNITTVPAGATVGGLYNTTQSIYMSRTGCCVMYYPPNASLYCSQFVSVTAPSSNVSPYVSFNGTFIRNGYGWDFSVAPGPVGVNGLSQTLTYNQHGDVSSGTGPVIGNL